MQCQLRVPAGEGRHGAVIVVPEAFGVTPGIVAECDRLAAVGYLALGIEIFHRTAPAGFVSSKFDFAEVGAHFKALTNDGLADDLLAARAFLAAHPRCNGKLGVVGYCVGGFAAYLGACRTKLSASVVYYGGGIVSARPQISALSPLLGERVTCPVLGLFGATDSSISESDRAAIDAALARQGVEHELVAYAGAGHAFRNDERPAYHREAADASWLKALAFLGKHLQ
jgi:carboxymethylenebutenolidase